MEKYGKTLDDSSLSEYYESEKELSKNISKINYANTLDNYSNKCSLNGKTIFF